MGEQNARRERRGWWAVALVLWIGFIWSRSLYGGEASSGQSAVVVDALAGLFRALGVSDAETMTFIVRKTGHFLEYLVLGVLTWLAFGLGRARGPRRVWLLVAACVLCAAVPAADETIQLFVPGRSGQVTDVLLDMCGCATGLALSALVARRRA